MLETGLSNELTCVFILLSLIRSQISNSGEEGLNFLTAAKVITRQVVYISLKKSRESVQPFHSSDREREKMVIPQRDNICLESVSTWNLFLILILILTKRIKTNDWNGTSNRLLTYNSKKRDY